MASSLKPLHHGRSLSLPYGSSDISVSQFDENLSRIRASTAPSSSLSSMNNQFSSLQKLYSNIDDLLMLPHIQQLISQKFQEKNLEEVLDGHIHLLDVCSSTKDLISHSKEDLQELRSSLRRKDANAIRNYSTSRKMSRKIVEKSLKNLKTLRGKDNIDHESISVMHMLKEAKSATYFMVDSLLTYTMGTRSQSLISRVVNSRKICDQTNEFDVLIKMSQDDEKWMDNLKTMESSIQILEQELECLFRQLIKTRVSLLNILNH